MSINQNENNYPGVQIASIVGNVGRVGFPPYDKEGKRGYKQVGIAVGEGYKDQDGQWVDTGTTWYNYNDKAEVIDQLGVGTGDKVRVDGGKQEVREYGEGKLGIDIRFGQLTVLISKNGGDAAPQGSQPASSDGDYF